MAQTHIKSDTGSPPGMPRWVKVFGILVISLALLMAILHLTGKGFGGHMHIHASTAEHGLQQP